MDDECLCARLESFLSVLRRNISVNGTEKLAVVTSGGTIVHLDDPGVRFIDNFSTGKRGSCIVESLLGVGYFVIHLARKNSHLPFLGKVVSYDSDLSLLDRFTLYEDGKIVFEPDSQSAYAIKALKDYSEHKKRLLVEHFTTLDEYRTKLETIARACTEFKERVAFCLAAAVSDFKVPEANMSREKLSSDSSVTLRLVPVQKIRLLVRSICGDEPLLCCFKLATNEKDLYTKAENMLKQPTSADMVVCNIFKDRKTKVQIIYPNGSVEQITDEDQELNERIADSLATAHSKRIESHQKQHVKLFNN